MIIVILKLTLGFVIGKVVGVYCAKNELNPILGLSLTAALVILACVLVDKILL
jgi:hypothetical protein